MMMFGSDASTCYTGCRLAASRLTAVTTTAVPAGTSLACFQTYKGLLYYASFPALHSYASDVPAEHPIPVAELEPSASGAGRMKIVIANGRRVVVDRGSIWMCCCGSSVALRGWNDPDPVRCSGVAGDGLHGYL